MADETRNVTTIYTIKNDPKNAATIRQTAREVEKTSKDRDKEEDRQHTRHRERQRQQAADARKAYDEVYKEGAKANAKILADEDRKNQQILAWRTRLTNNTIALEKRQADAKIRKTARAEREAGLLKNRGGFVGALFSSQRSELGAIGSQMRMLPSIPIPGTGMGSDQIANIIRMSGAAGQMGLGKGLGAIGGAAGFNTWGATGIAGSAAAGGAVVAGGVATAAAAAAAIVLWTERLKGSTDAVSSFTRTVGSFLAGVPNAGPSMGARGTIQSATYRQDSLATFDETYRRNHPGGYNESDFRRKRQEFAQGLNSSRIEREMANRAAFREQQRPFNQLDEQFENEGFQASRERAIGSAGRNKRGTAKELAENQAAIQATKAYYEAQKTKANSSGSSLDEQVDAFARLKEASKDLERLENERFDIAKRNSTETLDLQKQQLAASKQLLSEAKSELSSVRQQLGSNAERFLEADPFERAQMVAAARKAQSGQQLNYRDAKALRGLSGDVFHDAITNSALSELSGIPGASAILPKELVNRESDLKKQINELKITVKNEELVVKVTQATNENREKEISDAVGKVIADIFKDRDAQLKTQLEVLKRDILEKQKLQSRGGTT